MNILAFNAEGQYKAEIHDVVSSFVHFVFALIRQFNCLTV